MVRVVDMTRAPTAVGREVQLLIHGVTGAELHIKETGK